MQTNLWLQRTNLLIAGALELGTKMANGTYSDILGMLQSRSVDLYLRGESVYLHEDWLTKSIPFKMESVLLGQPIREQNEKVKFFNLLSNFKFGPNLLLSYLASFLAILVLVVLIDELTYRVQCADSRTIPIRKRIALSVKSFGDSKKLSAIAIFALFVNQFIWITQVFLTNNVKTNKVVSTFYV